MVQEIIIVGSGGLGREILANFKNSKLSDQFKVIGFVDDGEQKGTIINKIEVLGDVDYLLNCNNISIVLAIGNPIIRKKIAEKIGRNSSINFPNIIHPNVSIQDSEYFKIGKGCFISEGCIITTNVTLENFCFINIGCSLHHDTCIESYSVLMPGVRITGGATIGEASYISPNIALSKNIKIPKESILN